MVVTRHVSQKNAVDRVQPDKSRKNPPERRRIAVTSVLQLLPLALFFLGFPTPRPSLSCFLLCSFRRLISDDGINQQDYHKWRNDQPREAGREGVSNQRAELSPCGGCLFMRAGRDQKSERTNFGRDAGAAANFPSLPPFEVRHREVGRKFFPRFSRIYLQ